MKWWTPVVDDRKMAVVLSQFARTLTTEFSIQTILERLVESIVEILPITGAGVTLISGGSAPRYVAASNDDALRYEQLQTRLGQGPSQLAYSTGEAVSVPNLATDTRFPRFGSATARDGLVATFTFPLRAVEGPLGALDLYSDTLGRLGPSDMEAAQTLADVAAAYLLNARSREETQAASDRLRHIALHDPLTGLPNRVLLQQRMAHAAHRARRSRTHAGVLFADVDQFKAVNDTYGHQVGDLLLIAIAIRLAAAVRPGDTLARLFGDEFVVLCEDLHTSSDVELLAERLRLSFAQPFLVGGATISVSASVGMAFAGPGTSISDRLIDQADTAMYEAKRAGAAQRVIDLRGNLHMNHGGGSLQSDLVRALGEGQLSVAYQPIVRTADAGIVGVEALVRWKHPERGNIPAASIIEAAEAEGIISELGAWVLEQACLAHHHWSALAPERPLDLAVNVSGTQMLAPDFTATVDRILARTRMDPKQLILEMTESILIANSEITLAVLDSLHDRGIRLALDDFGTGYSALSYLHRLPIACLKIDQVFVAAIGRTESGSTIVSAVTALAHALGLTVVAEGVESLVQRDAVAALGCERAQGYFFARPMAADDVAALLPGDGQFEIVIPAPTVLPVTSSMRMNDPVTRLRRYSS